MFALDAGAGEQRSSVARLLSADQVGELEPVVVAHDAALAGPLVKGPRLDTDSERGIARA